MNMAICSLASGSSGNCYVVRSPEGFVLVDAGVSCRQIKEGLKSIGLNLSDLSAVLVTHDHSDHIKGLPVLLKHCNAKVYANEATSYGIPAALEEANFCQIETGKGFGVCGMEVLPFAVSHDTADPVGFTLRRGGRQISIVTDTGTVTPQIMDQIRGADILVLESNHDEAVLRMGPYPWFLKQRILGERGHLSNETASLALAKALEEERLAGIERKRIVLLAHLSKENNFPEMAMQTMLNILEERELGENITIQVLRRDALSPVYSL